MKRPESGAGSGRVQVTQRVSDQPRPEPSSPTLTASAAASLLSLHRLPTPTGVHPPHKDSVSDVLILGLLMVPSVLKPQGLCPGPSFLVHCFSSPHSPCSSHVASALECTMLLPASGSLHMLFHIPRMLFPSFPSHCTLLPNHLMCHLLQAAHPDHPDAPAPQLDT